MFVLAEPAITVRATTLTSPAEEAPWPDPSTATADQLRLWLTHQWQESEFFARAVRVASPSLAEQLDRVRTGEVGDLGRLRRCAVSLMRYLIRSRSRPTPFGIFAGVTPAKVGTTTRVSWGQAHQAVARPDALWLHEYAQHLTTQHHQELTVVAASTLLVSGDRLVREWLPGTTEPDEAVPISVRHTPATAMAVELARDPRPLREIEDTLCSAFPSTSRPTVTRMLNQLVHTQILLSSAHPPMSSPDPLAHLLRQCPEQAPAARAHALLLRHNTTGPDDAGNQVRRQHAQDQLWKACPAPTPLAVDTRVDAQLTLAPTVIDTAQEAAQTLLALAPNRSGAPAWVDYHLRCLERYGPGAVIALSELVGPTGMGWPSGYRGSYLPPPAPEPLTSRDHALTRAAHTAALNGSGEVDALDLIRHLPATEEPVPPHVEVRAQLQAASPAAVDAGELTLWITGLSRAVGVLTGRFSHLEGITDHGHAHLPTLTEGALPAQISAPPLVTSAHNVARTPPLLPDLLVIDEHPPTTTPDGPQVLGPEDLLVRIDADHLRLQHRATGRVIEPQLFSALEPRWHTHPLVRFCYELPRARTAPHLSFTWPSATETWSRLPRVRAGQAILAPALWRIKLGQFPAPGASTTAWEYALQRLHDEQQLPHLVRISEGDSFLTLDLEQPAHRSLLRNHLERSKADTPLTLTETPPANAFAWCDTRAHELVIPLASAQTPTTTPRSLTEPSSPATAMHLPGSSTWLSAHLYCDADLHSRILTQHMRSLWERWGSEPAWWAVRYADHDGPHLRLRIPNHHPDSLLVLARWANQMHQVGLLRHMSLQTYQPETGRYGHGPALEAVHALFSADTTATLAQLRHSANDPSRAHALGAASLLHLATSAHPANALEWMTNYLSKPTAPVDRTAHSLALTLTDLDHGAVPADLREAWHGRNRAMATYRECLPTPGDLLNVLPSLVHMHHNRFIGPDRADENRLLGLTRALALTVLHRTPAVVR